METAEMVKKKATPKSKPSRPALAVTVRGSGQWKQWIEELADHCRMDVSTLVDLALVDFAKARGFGTPAPKR
jgi:hypothetical protein